ncbi:RNA polymerase B [Scheffersomyces spartinae]|uniref:RNA polymerase B n=1 Tax=Scheffersomyces spartinae TaxID=45513 RepID=A0A9P7V704_9ASCO|nr:RNA polymerase B [Scheffersomyces spartinae]KAG7192288.1 RNA polymerase B [Scheffersomyces spartinae]
MNVSTSTLGVRRRKAAQNIDDEESAATLKLGPEFQLRQITNNGDEEQLIALNLSEARLLMRAALKERKSKNTASNKYNQHEADEGNEDDEDDSKFDELMNNQQSEIVRKSLAYLSTFARFKNSSSTETVEKLLNDFSASCLEPLHPFEIAQLGNLDCEDAEEAKSLIPSLSNKVSDIQLQNLLSELKKYQSLA